MTDIRAMNLMCSKVGPTSNAPSSFEEQLEPECWMYSGIFATLDRRSFIDNTVVMHHHRYPDNVWESWRIKFEDGFFMLVGLTENLDEYDITFTQADRFTTPDGVFPAREASNITEREGLKNARGDAQL